LEGDGDDAGATGVVVGLRAKTDDLLRNAEKLSECESGAAHAVVVAERARIKPARIAVVRFILFLLCCKPIAGHEDAGPAPCAGAGSGLVVWAGGR
jgi:hypothetical protein